MSLTVGLSKFFESQAATEIKPCNQRKCTN